MKTICAIGLGSNLASVWGDRQAALHEALRRLAPLGRVTALSAFFDTEPVGYTDQPRFLNAALLLETELDAHQVMHGLLQVERAMGRDRLGVVPKGPRIIDLDLLLFGNAVIRTPELTVPHPALAERRFVLQPLAEIAPALAHPLTGRTVQQMLARLGQT